MKRLVRALACFLALGTASCRDGTTPASRTSASGSTSGQLAEKIETLEAEVATLRSRVYALESDSTEISTAGEAYGIARTKFGPFTFVSRGVAPHLDGYKIKLAVGNLTGATFHGAKLKVEWGPPYKAGKLDEYAKNRKEREFSVTTVLYPGTYSIVEVTLVPAKPEEVRMLTVGLQLNEMSFRR